MRSGCVLQKEVDQFQYVKRIEKLEFDYLQLLVASLQCHNGGIATVVFDRIRLSKNERWNQL